MQPKQAESKEAKLIDGLPSAQHFKKGKEVKLPFKYKGIRLNEHLSRLRVSSRLGKEKASTGHAKPKSQKNEYMDKTKNGLEAI